MAARASCDHGRIVAADPVVPEFVVPDFAVPKHKVGATLRLLGQAPVEVELFLGESAARHSGHERPSDLLQMAEPFLAVQLKAGGVLFASRHNILVLSIASDVELGEEDLPVEDLAAEETKTADVVVRLEDGSSISGNVVYLMPVGHRRLQDYLNALPEAFLKLRNGDLVHLVNKERIVLVTAH